MPAKLDLVVSPFNILLDRGPGGASYAFNGATGATLRVQTRVAEALRRGQTSRLFPGERALLSQKGMLVSDPDQQKRAIRLKYEAMMRPAASSSFVVMPTRSCNLVCSYCYEARQPAARNRITPQIADRIVRFIAREIDAPGKTSSILKFYGGEPLLELATCRSIAQKAVAAAEALKQQMYIWIQTNGTLIDEKTCTGFPRVDCVEITIDGAASRHDTIRTNRRKTPTFDRIMRSLQVLDRQGYAVSLRINAHSGEEMRLALEDLDHYGVKAMPKLYFYDGQVSDTFLEHVQGMRCPDELIGPKQIAIVEEIRAVVKELGWENKYQRFPFFNKHTGICSFGRPGSFCIDSKGDLYLCIFQVSNPDFRVGAIQDDGAVEFEPRYHEIMARNPFEHQECVDCSLLPRCWGGCFAKAYAHTGSYSAPFCDRLAEMVPVLLEAQIRENCR